MKKDYLGDGSMADSADLVVLGGWCGTGKKGGQISTFLMGVPDEVKGRWCTVTKVALGFDDATLARLQKELAPTMDRIAGEYDRVPHWLDVTRQMVPEFIVRKPEESPVWEVTGAEFSKAEIHTAGGISIRCAFIVMVIVIINMTMVVIINVAIIIVIIIITQQVPEDDEDENRQER